MFYYIHTNCIHVDGYKKSIIIDLLRYRYIQLSNYSIKLVFKYEGINLNTLNWDSKDEFNAFLSLIDDLEKEDYLHYRTMPKKTISKDGMILYSTKTIIMQK